MCAQAALRTGCGLVTVGAPKSVVPIIAVQAPELMTLPLVETAAQTLSMAARARIAAFVRERATVAAVGPGLSRHPQTELLARHLIERLPCPLVVDADALNALAQDTAVVRRAAGPRILTPHPGEMSRLTGLSVAAIQRARRRIARRYAKLWKAVVVLKGHCTVIAAPDGQASVNTTGNPGMATGGTGDVLTGMIAGLLAQGLKPFEAARLGVYLHGLAGDLAAKQFGQASLIASDLLDTIPTAIRMLNAK